MSLLGVKVFHDGLTVIMSISLYDDDDESIIHCISLHGRLRAQDRALSDRAAAHSKIMALLGVVGPTVY